MRISCSRLAVDAPRLETCARPTSPVPQKALRNAAEKGLDLLVKTSPTFIKKGGCNSCHAQILPAAAQAVRAEQGHRGGRADRTTAGRGLRGHDRALRRVLRRRRRRRRRSSAFDFFARSLASTPADARMRAQIHFVKSQQQPEGTLARRRGAHSVVVSRAEAAPASGTPAAHLRRLHADRIHDPGAQRLCSRRRCGRYQGADRPGASVAACDEGRAHAGARLQAARVEMVERRPPCDRCRGARTADIAATGRRMVAASDVAVGCLCDRHRPVRVVTKPAWR